jgi:hypothetical protein
MMGSSFARDTHYTQLTVAAGQPSLQRTWERRNVAKETATTDGYSIFGIAVSRVTPE